MSRAVSQENVNFTLVHGGKFVLIKPSVIHDWQLAIDFAPISERHCPFFAASKVAKYSAFKSAVSLGNTLLWLFNRRNALFRLSIALVVYITFLTSAENLNWCYIEYGGQGWTPRPPYSKVSHSRDMWQNCTWLIFNFDWMQGINAKA